MFLYIPSLTEKSKYGKIVVSLSANKSLFDLTMAKMSLTFI